MEAGLPISSTRSASTIEKRVMVSISPKVRKRGHTSDTGTFGTRLGVEHGSSWRSTRPEAPSAARSRKRRDRRSAPFVSRCTCRPARNWARHSEATSPPGSLLPCTCPQGENHSLHGQRTRGSPAATHSFRKRQPSRLNRCRATSHRRWRSPFASQVQLRERSRRSIRTRGNFGPTRCGAGDCSYSISLDRSASSELRGAASVWSDRSR